MHAEFRRRRDMPHRRRAIRKTEIVRCFGADRFISRRDYADRTDAALIQLNFTGLSGAEFKIMEA
jgi:hypothetical protein